MRKWVDGFKALESLDVNKDAKVAGEELKDLALWFDYNKNAVSENGEVKRLDEVGVVSLYYAGQSDTDSLSIIAKHGYDIVLNRVTHEGRSVDWFARAAFESFIKAGQFSSKIEDAAFFEKHISDARDLDEAIKKHQVDKQARVVASPISGQWRWKVIGTGDGLPGGILDIQENNGVLSGYSKVMGPNGGEGHFPLSGLLQNNKDGELSYKMSVGADKQLAVISKITLSKDGGMLSGISVQPRSIFGSKDNRKVVMTTYSWKASRVK